MDYSAYSRVWHVAHRFEAAGDHVVGFRAGMSQTPDGEIRYESFQVETGRARVLSASATPAVRGSEVRFTVVTTPETEQLRLYSETGSRIGQ